MDADEAVRRATDRLRAASLRVTTPRRAVIHVLAGRHDPMTAEQIVTAVGADGHRASVYRTLELLVERSVVDRRLAPGGGPVYHLATVAPEHEHLHLVCSGCGAVGALPVTALHGAVDGIRAATGFVVDAPAVTLPGRCERCAAGLSRQQHREA
ncbi:transcriptional repressor [Isoptericola halotolerans]